MKFNWKEWVAVIFIAVLAFGYAAINHYAPNILVQTGLKDNHCNDTVPSNMAIAFNKETNEYAVYKLGIITDTLYKFVQKELKRKLTKDDSAAIQADRYTITPATVFLTKQGLPITFTSVNLAPPKTFKDSCEAKAAIREYLLQ